MTLTYLVRDAMRKEVVTIGGKESLVKVAKVMTKKQIGCVIVVEQAKPVGIITEKDFVVKAISKGLDPRKLKARDVMTKDPVSTEPDTDLYEAVKLMKEHGVRRIPVIKDEILYGILGPKELAESFTPYVDKLTREILRAGMGLTF